MFACVCLGVAAAPQHAFGICICMYNRNVEVCTHMCIHSRGVKCNRISQRSEVELVNAADRKLRTRARNHPPQRRTRPPPPPPPTPAAAAAPAARTALVVAVHVDITFTRSFVPFLIVTGATSPSSMRVNSIRRSSKLQPRPMFCIANTHAWRCAHHPPRHTSAPPHNRHRRRRTRVRAQSRLLQSARVPRCT